MIKELFKISKSTHGKGPVLFRWDPTGKYLATLGASRRVYVWERNGDQFDEFPVLASTAPKGQPPSQILQIEWNKDGEILAVLQDGSSVIQLYHLNEKKTRELETNFKDPSFMCWARAGPQLAIGTAKGNLILYNTTTMKSQVIQGKHTKKITCGSWNLENKLALASQDRMMTVSDDKGELLEQAKLKYDPFDIQFAEQKMDELKNDVKENTISINMGHQTILMYNMADTENPVELAFQAKYGEIASYRWFGDGYMMVGFSKGYVIAISTHMKEIGEELQSLKVHEGVLYDVCYAPVLNRLASCGDDGVRIVDMSDWKEVKTEHREFSKEEGDPERMDWTKDGQILTVATNGGYVFNFLMSIPALSAYNGSKLVYLSSLRHVSVIDVANESTPAINVEIAVEPSFIALGPNHVAVGMNNHSWFYPISGKSESNAAIEREYVGTVKQICLNDLYAAVLCDGKVHLHLIMPDSSDKRDYISFPEKDDAQVTSISLTNDFLIYCTSRGTVHHWYIKDWAQVNEYRHDVSVNRVFSNSIGTRIVFIDANNKGILYSPVDDSRVEIPSFPPSIESILWDLTDPSTLIAVDPKLQRNLITYNYTSQSIKGPVVVKVSNTKFPHGFAPIMFYDGMVHGQKPNGSLSLIALSSHDAITNVKGRRNTDKLRQALQQLLALNRLKQAWDLALMMKNKEQMVTLARKAMEQLDIELAIRVYRELKDSAMVLALQEIIHVEDKHLLAGHICLLNGDYSKAQSLFLTSSYPIAALQMRRDLLHWDHALKLAASLSPEQMPYICREYAQQLEVKGEHKMALDMYQKGLSEAKDSLTDDHRQICNGGIARMTLRMGDLPKGRKLALESGKKELMKECAAILESMKQYNEAAEMYVFAENFEKAASIYCSLKNFTKAAPLMDKITTPKIHLQYAKAKESEKDYAAAAAAYEKAKDLDSVVRINLQYLDNPQKAYNIVRATKSATGAATVSNYCKENNDIAGAVEFLLMAKRSDEAFLLAKQNKSMDVYAKALADDGSQDEYTNIALHYEEEKDYSRAGHFYAICGDYQKAIKLFLQSEDPKNIDAAINVVKRAQGQPGAELLVRQLHDFLIGETDGKVKDLNFIFRLYMAIGEYQQAANTAILIANQEQQVGQYTTAHGILFAMHQDLIAQKLPIPTDLKRNLLLLHSYVLAKKMTAKSEHEGAARMLIRVAKNITKFPAHVVPILTSTVIECQRAKLQRTCYEYAAMLMRPEYRNSVDQKYRKPIETFVRRPVHEEANEKLTACPFCQFELPETLLECPSCKNSIPYCIASGRHMIYNDWTNCPSCKFPALYSVFFERIKADKICYMCNQQVSLADVKRIDDPKPFLLKNEADEKKTTKAPAATGAGSAAGEINPLDITPNFK